MTTVGAKKTACECGKQFYDHSGLRKHRKKCELTPGEVQQEDGGRKKKKCGICMRHFTGFSDLCAHLESVHNKRAQINTFEFDSEKKFETWKENRSWEAVCEFKKYSSQTQKSGLQHMYFKCHRSGSYMSVGSEIGRAPRSTPTIICGFDCSAFITSHKALDGRLSIKACLDHYGHDNHPGKLHIPKDVELKVVRKQRPLRRVREEKRKEWKKRGS